MYVSSGGNGAVAISIAPVRNGSGHLQGANTFNLGGNSGLARGWSIPAPYV
jgi:hypothetical protein